METTNLFHPGKTYENVSYDNDKFFNDLTANDVPYLNDSRSTVAFTLKRIEKGDKGFFANVEVTVVNAFNALDDFNHTYKLRARITNNTMRYLANMTMKPGDREPMSNYMRHLKSRGIDKYTNLYAIRNWICENGSPIYADCPFKIRIHVESETISLAVVNEAGKKKSMSYNQATGQMQTKWHIIKTESGRPLYTSPEYYRRLIVNHPEVPYSSAPADEQFMLSFNNS